MDYQVISADCHIDLPWLPEGLFVGEAPADLKDRMPYVDDTLRGRYWVSRNGARFGLQNGMGSAGRRYVPGQIHRSDRMAEQGLYRDGERGIRRLTDPHLRIRDQDLDGVWPDSRDFIARELGGVSSETRRKIICDNAAHLYGFG